MDVVNHGQDFVNSVIEYIASQLSLVADPTGTLLQSADNEPKDTPFALAMAPSLPSMIHTQSNIIRSPFGDTVRADMIARAGEFLHDCMAGYLHWRTHGRMIAWCMSAREHG